MLADLVVLSDDIVTAAPAGVAAAEVVLTVFDGRIVYRRPSAATN